MNTMHQLVYSQCQQHAKEKDIFSAKITKAAGVIKALRDERNNLKAKAEIMDEEVKKENAKFAGLQRQYEEEKAKWELEMEQWKKEKARLEGDIQNQEAQLLLQSKKVEHLEDQVAVTENKLKEAKETGHEERVRKFFGKSCWPPVV